MAEVDAGAVMPVVPVTPASTDAPDIVSTADAIPEADKPVAPERTFTQKEVNEIASKRAAQAERHALKVARAEVERDLYKQQLEEARRPPPNAAPKDGEPQQKDFTDYEEYILARAEWRVEQKLAKGRESAQRESATQQERRAMAEQAQTIQSRFKSAELKYPDFRDVVTGDVPFTEPMVAFFGDSEVAGEIAYHLGNNVEEAARIAKLSPGGQFRELVKLESKLSAPPKPTQTPAPIVPGRANSAGSKSMLDMTQDEFEKHREARLKRK